MWPFKRKHRLDNTSNTRGVDLVAKDYPSSVISEQFRTIRTNVSFSKASGQLRSIMITSDAPSEGKSTISANLAVTWANQGHRILLVDSDLRRPTVHKTFRLPNNAGLSTYLADETDLNHTIQPTMIDNLYVIPSGPIPPNPSELLGSDQMDNMLRLLYSEFDLVILDTPPIDSTSDASVLAAKADGVIMVIPQGIAKKAGVKSALDQLKKVHARLLGAIMNHVTQNKTSSYYYYYYYRK